MLYVGTSGWQYAHWREVLYPRGLPQRQWLSWYAERFQTVELNNSFYRLPEAASFERWHDETPEHFVFAVKMSRFLTHIRRLRDPAQPVSLLLERARPLGTKLGPVLVQLPPGMRADAGRLDTALGAFPGDTRVAVEFRERSWFTDEIRAILERHGAALCLADSPRIETPIWRTAGWGFVRFHHGLGHPQPCYEERALDRWARQLAELWPGDADAFVYFNNDWLGCAVRDAALFAHHAQAAGLRPTRVPAPLTITPS